MGEHSVTWIAASRSWLATSTEQPGSAPAAPPLAMPALPPLPWAVLLTVLPVAVPPELVVCTEPVVPPPDVPCVSEVPPVSEVPLPPEEFVVLTALFDESDSELEQAASTARIETEKAKAEAGRPRRSRVCMARSIPHSVRRCDQGAWLFAAYGRRSTGGHHARRQGFEPLAPRRRVSPSATSASPQTTRPNSNPRGSAPGNPQAQPP